MQEKKILRNPVRNIFLDPKNKFLKTGIGNLAGCHHIASCRPLVASPSRQLILPACCCIASPRPPIVPCPPSRPLVARLVVALPLDTPPSRHLIVSACHLALSRPARWLLCQHLLSSSCCTALSSSYHAGWLLRCLSLRRPLVLSS
jgi:hypothetical protein